MKQKYKSAYRKSDSDDNDEIKMQENYLGYFSKTIPTEIMTVYIDEPVKHPSYYRQVVQGIEELGDGDQLRFHISSPGGRLDGLEAILAAMSRTDATTIAFIESDCHSAASILALNCDIVSVSPYASALIHFVSFGSAGASNHVLKHAEHIKKTSERLFRDTYKYFLTEEEITRCIEDDYQLWLDADQIAERLEHRQKMQDSNINDAALQDSNNVDVALLEEEESYDCENCCGEDCSSYSGCTASIDADDFDVTGKFDSEYTPKKSSKKSKEPLAES